MKVLDMRIRRLIPGDDALAAALARRHKSASASLEHLADFLARPECILIAALEGDEPIGFLLAYELMRIDGPRPKIILYEIGVDERYRRRGAGRALITELQRIARQRRALNVFVITDATNVPAVRLYESTGGVRPCASEAVFEYDCQ